MKVGTRLVTILVILAIAFAAFWVVESRKLATDYDAELWEYLHAGYAGGVVRALANGADANSTNEFGHPTTLYSAAIADPQPMQMLIDGGALANDKWSEMDAICSVTRIKPFGGKPGHRDAQGWMMQGKPTTPLAVAAKYGNYETAMVLLEASAEIRPWDHTDESVLHLAVLGQSTQLVQEIIDRGVAPTADDLMIACKLYDLEMVKILLANGADIDSMNGLGSTPIEIAWYFYGRDGTDGLLKYLLGEGAIPKQWMLDNATKNGDVEIARLLQANSERDALP